MEKLVSGVHKFHKEHFCDKKDLYEHLVKHGQKPETLFITCSDSRIDPEKLTQADPGEMFVIRNAGNMIPNYDQAKVGYSGEAATLQYAVEILNVRDIVICGHTDCGAVKAMMDPPKALTQLDLLSTWLDQESQLRQSVQANYGRLDTARQLTAAIEENVLFQLDDLRTYPFIQKRLDEGRLTLHGWIYHIARGKVYAYDPLDGQFLSIEDAYPNVGRLVAATDPANRAAVGPGVTGALDQALGHRAPKQAGVAAGTRQHEG